MSNQQNTVQLAANMRKLRKHLNLSQEAFAALVGLSRSNIASYENLKAEPRIRKVAEIAQQFNLSLDQLILGNPSTLPDALDSSDMDRASTVSNALSDNTILLRDRINKMIDKSGTPEFTLPSPTLKLLQEINRHHDEVLKILVQMRQELQN